MTPDQDFQNALRDFSSKRAVDSASIAKVLSVNEDDGLIDVELLGGLEMYDVRLKATPGPSNSYLLSIPVIGSFVAIGKLEANGDEQCVLMCSEVSKLILKTVDGLSIEIDSKFIMNTADGVEVKFDSAIRLRELAGAMIEIKDSKLKLANNVDSLGSILGDLILAINAIQVTTPAGASTPPLLNAIQFEAISARLNLLLDA
jgi:hypothetical protein